MTDASANDALPTRCWWGFHKWTKWAAPVQGVRQVLGWEPEPVMVQERTCLLCNRRELRTP